MARILLVEDDGVLREDLGQRLKEWGHEVDLANDLDPAFAALRLRKPEIILSDIMLPSGSGFDLLRRIDDLKFGFLDTPVIMISSLDDQASKLYGEFCGAVDYLTKPVDYPILKDLIDRHLQVRTSWWRRTLLSELPTFRANRAGERREKGKRSSFGVRR